MLAKKNRLNLRKHPDFFLECDLKRKYLETANVVWRINSDDLMSEIDPKVAIIVPKKYVRLSVNRHQIKRKWVELIKAEIGGWARGLEIVIIVKKNKMPLEENFKFLPKK